MRDQNRLTFRLVSKPLSSQARRVEVKDTDDNCAVKKFEVRESPKSRLSDMCVVVISCFHSILHLKTNDEGASDMNFLLQYSNKRSKM